MTGTKPITSSNSAKWLLIVFSAVLLVAFFIPWVSWDKNQISGADMPLGNFFRISEQNYGLANPFPQFNSFFFTVWIIPALAILIILLAFLNKKTVFVSVFTGVIALSHITVYILFTNVLRDLGAAHSLLIGIYIAIIGAAGIILVSARSWFKKFIWLIVGPVIVYSGFYEVSKYLENQKFDNTANTSSVYTVNAPDLISEFHANDSLANAKYREKIVTVNGNISSLETPNDSTVNVKFADSTGSYAIFTFHEADLDAAKKLKTGDKVSIKGSCSGGVLSEILGIESISFKRCTLNK